MTLNVCHETWNTFDWGCNHLLPRDHVWSYVEKLITAYHAASLTDNTVCTSVISATCSTSSTAAQLSSFALCHTLMTSCCVQWSRFSPSTRFSEAPRLFREAGSSPVETSAHSDHLGQNQMSSVTKIPGQSVVSRVAIRLKDVYWPPPQDGIFSGFTSRIVSSAEPYESKK